MYILWDYPYNVGSGKNTSSNGILLILPRANTAIVFLDTGFWQKARTLGLIFHFHEPY